MFVHAIANEQSPQRHGQQTRRSVRHGSLPGAMDHAAGGVMRDKTRRGRGSGPRGKWWTGAAAVPRAPFAPASGLRISRPSPSPLPPHPHASSPHRRKCICQWGDGIDHQTAAIRAISGSEAAIDYFFFSGLSGSNSGGDLMLIRFSGRQRSGQSFYYRDCKTIHFLLSRKIGAFYHRHERRRNTSSSHCFLTTCGSSARRRSSSPAK